MDELCLKSMADDRLLEGVAVLARRSNELTAELLAYLGEVDARGLHLGEACSSLFAFCVERLHMSESAAGKRITAARFARRFPLVLEMIGRGEIHLTAVNMLAAHLTEENHAADTCWRGRDTGASATSRSWWPRSHRARICRREWWRFRSAPLHNTCTRRLCSGPVVKTEACLPRRRRGLPAAQAMRVSGCLIRLFALEAQ